MQRTLVNSLQNRFDSRYPMTYAKWYFIMEQVEITCSTRIMCMILHWPEATLRFSNEIPNTT